MEKRPLIGILGGMGTAAGIHFQNLLFDVCNEKGICGDQDYPEWIYFNAALAPDRTEALLGRGPSPEEYLVSVLKRMQSAGVDIIAAVCNTVHSFHDAIFEQVPIPWIDLQKETAKAVQRAGFSSAALMSTEGTLKSGLFKKAFQPLGIDYQEPHPDSDIQRKITDAIYDREYGIKYTGSRISTTAERLLLEAAAQFNSDVIIAGCTELSFVFPDLKLERAWIDPLKIAAETCFNIWKGERQCC